MAKAKKDSSVVKMADVDKQKVLQARDMVDHIEPQDTGGVAGVRLKSFIERIERLEEEKAELSEDIKEIYAEAKGVGFDTKTIRRIVRLRKMDAEKRREESELLDLYAAAIGMQGVLL